MSPAPLHLHIQRTWDGAPAEPSEGVELHLEASGDGLRVTVDAPLHGDPPPDGPPGPRWALWEHEVVELFVVGPDEVYLEVEVGPWGHHLVLQLEGRRTITRRELPLRWAPTRAAGRWGGAFEVPRAWLPPGPHRLNAYTLHGVGPARRYLAWAPVPGPAPDFHRLECLPTVLLPVVPPLPDIPAPPSGPAGGVRPT